MRWSTTTASTTWRPRPALLLREREKARSGEAINGEVRYGELGRRSARRRERERRSSENGWHVSALFFRRAEGMGEDG
jgi:hypothetical protein